MARAAHTGEQPQAAEPSDLEAVLVAVLVAPTLGDASEDVGEDESEDELPPDDAEVSFVPGRLCEPLPEWLPLLRWESRRESLL
jgi:hypothetical protein